MPKEQLGECIDRIDALLSKFENLTDGALRQDVQEIVRCLLDYHAAAVARLLNLLQGAEHESSGLATRIAQDELVSSLLLLHGLHPADLESRVLEALRRVRPFLESHGGNVELTGLAEGVVHLRLDGNCHGCPSSAATLTSRIEQAIYELAPEIEGIEVDQEAHPPAKTGAFVPLEQLAAR